MLKIIIIIIFFLYFASPVLAIKTAPTTCIENSYCEGGKWWKKSNCEPIPGQEGEIASKILCICEAQTTGESCTGKESQDEIRDVFGRIEPPAPVANLGFGAAGIGNFLTALINLIFSAAGIVFIFMLLWGAFQWLISGGEKEKLAQAQQRIIHALIGLVLFAIAFALIGIIGVFTGFELFKGQAEIFKKAPQDQQEQPEQTKEKESAPKDKDKDTKDKNKDEE